MVSDNVLIVGFGSREHAFGWKIAQSKHVGKIYFAPGNGGTSENIDIKHNDVDKLVSFAKRQNNLLTVVGPEEPLSLGIVDAFEKEGLRIFGPRKEPARLETSKAFAKEFMHDAGIRTPEFAIFSDAQKAKDYVVRQSRPQVIKADGLAAGKGVVVCDGADQAIAVIDSMMIKKEFGAAGTKVIIEERLSGEEVSFIALCDGKTIMPLAPSQDHKRISDDDKGPNTGGMGAYSPTPVIDSELHEKIVKDVMQPAMIAIRKRGTPFKGFLYAGIMIDENTKKPYVLEFNVRMGDPECQPIVMRMKPDLYEYINAAVDGQLESMSQIEWKNQTAVCVIMAARGYPGSYEKGKVIEGLNSEFGPYVMVFHAGTARDSQGRIVTNGGRVLAVTALGEDARRAIDNAYSAVRKIRWGENDHYYRTDIARRAIGR
ncbi:MAG TPA: phosphoribosylamine--glycine ligase [Nitrososphaera sp.]|jgi:phosphoribosylamine--glycine ligase|nr:phosphoribosylamine--glycine ligase [Nitrososphaera sp.]